MTEPRWDLIHDAVITDDPFEVCCTLCGDFHPDIPNCLDPRLDQDEWLDKPDVTRSDCA